MKPEFLQWLDNEIDEAGKARHAEGLTDERRAEHRAEWLALEKVKDQIKDILYKEAME